MPSGSVGERVLGAGHTAQVVEGFPAGKEAFGLIPSSAKLRTVVHAYNPSTRETDTGAACLAM